MKRTFVIISTILLSLIGSSIYAQAPEGFVYQAEIRNSKGRVLSNSDISIDIRILNQEINVNDWVQIPIKVFTRTDLKCAGIFHH